MKSVSISFVALLSFAACDSNPTAPGIPANAREIEFTVVDTTIQSGFSSFTVPMRTVIRAQEAFEAFWGDIHSGLNPTPNPPVLDFDKSMLVVAASGTRPNSGYSISVKTVAREGDQLFVHIEETFPGAECITLQVITSPVTGILVTKTDAQVEFVETQRRFKCE